MHDVRRKMAKNKLRPIPAHKKKIEALLGKKIKFDEENLGGAHGGALLKGIKVDDEFVPLEAVKKIGEVETRIITKIQESKLKHLRIPKIIELTKNKLVMDYVPGKIVTDFSKDFNDENEEERKCAGELFESAVEGLKELHAIGISRGRYDGMTEMHGLNFKVGEDGRLYWFDFGGSNDEARPQDKAFDIKALVAGGIPVSNKGRTEEYKMQRILDVYFRDELTADGLAVLEELAHHSWVEPISLKKQPEYYVTQMEECNLFKDRAKTMLSKLPKNVRSDLLKDFWRLREKTEFRPDRGSSGYKPGTKEYDHYHRRRNLWLEEWQEVLDSA